MSFFPFLTPRQVCSDETLYKNMKNKYKVIIITCWSLLVLAFIAKLLGADIFYPSTNNQTFIKLCDYIDNHNLLKYTIYCIISLVLNSLSFLAILGQRFYTKIQAIIFIPLIIAMSLVSWYSMVINIIIGIILCLLPIIWLKQKWYRVLIGICLILLFQVISIATKSIGGWNLNDEKSLITILLQFDKFNEYDWSYVLNMIYSDYYGSVQNDVTTYAKMAKKFLMDKDAKEGKALCYYLAMK